MRNIIIMSYKNMGNPFCSTHEDPRTKQQIQSIQYKRKNEYNSTPLNKPIYSQAEEQKKCYNRNASCKFNYKRNHNENTIKINQPKNKDDYLVSSSAYVSGLNYSHNSNISNSRITSKKENIYNNITINNDLCGIKNVGNNCYLNSGLQILARSDIFVNKLIPFNNNKFPFTAILYQAFESLLNKKVYDPSLFIKYFCQKNQDFIIGEQSCSQNFIRTVLNNVNDEIKSSSTNCLYSYKNYNPKNPNEIAAYNNYIRENHIFPESDALNTFTGILKSHTYGVCKCKNVFDKNTFCYFIDQNMYLDNIYQKCYFKKVIEENLPPNNEIEMECEKCKKMMKLTEETKLVKLPEILVFTLERFLGGVNKVEIIPDDILDLQNYADPNLTGVETLYELFAINIRFGSTKNWGHEICQIKINGYWYEFNDSSTNFKKRDYFDCSYGLYYRWIRS